MATHSSILAWRIPMERGAWWAIVHRVTKSQTGLSATQQQQHVITRRQKMLWDYFYQKKKKRERERERGKGRKVQGSVPPKKSHI